MKSQTICGFIGMVAGFLLIGYAGDPTLRILGGLFLIASYTLVQIGVIAGRNSKYKGKYTKKKKYSIGR